MEFYKALNNGQPDAIIEGYESLIWTERYSTFGEFQLKTPMIEETLQLLSYSDGEGGYVFNDFSFFTHKDTSEVMMFDNYTIEENEDGVETLTITGRSMYSILEDRNVEGLRGDPWKQMQMYTSVEFAAALAWDALGMGFNTGPYDPYPIVSKIFQIQQATNTGYVPTVSIHRSLAAAQDWFAQPGEAWKQMADALTLDRVGVRMIHPPFQASVAGVTPTYELSFNSTTGAVTYHGVGDYTTNDDLQLNFYTGFDRPNVIFDWETGDIESAKYLYSTKNWKNVAYVLSSTTSYDDVWVYADGASDVFSGGEARRSIVVDPGEDQGSLSGADYETLLRQKGDAELRKYRKERMVDATISANTPYTYKVDYDLGDTVTVNGRYGFVETMMVSEHIRTDDQQGDREFPTLVRNDIVEV